MRQLAPELFGIEARRNAVARALTGEPVFILGRHPSPLLRFIFQFEQLPPVLQQRVIGDQRKRHGQKQEGALLLVHRQVRRDPQAPFIGNIENDVRRHRLLLRPPFLKRIAILFDKGAELVKIANCDGIRHSCAKRQQNQTESKQDARRARGR